MSDAATMSEEESIWKEFKQAPRRPSARARHRFKVSIYTASRPLPNNTVKPALAP
jgi:hypothetical protein